jgi:hypothetical protein
MANRVDGTIEGIDQVAATITAALISSTARPDELGSVNLFFKIRALLVEQDRRNPLAPSVTKPR